jgi:hypothetical protein
MPRPRKSLIAVLVLFCAIAAFQASEYVLGRIMAPRLEKEISSLIDAEAKLENMRFSFLSGAQVARLVISSPENPDQPGTFHLEIQDLSVRHSLKDLIFGQYRVTGVRIRELETSATPAALPVLSALRKKIKPKQRFPDIRIISGNIRVQHPDFPQGFHIRRLSARRLGNGQMEIEAQGFFDGNENPIKAHINVDPGQIRASAQLSISGYPLSGLPAEPLLEKFPQLRQLPLDQTVTGKIAARYDHASQSLIFSRGRFETGNTGFEISSAGMDFDDSGLCRAWINADLREVELSLADRLDIFKDMPKKFHPRITDGKLRGRLNGRWNRSAGFAWDADLTVESGSVFLPGLNTRVDAIDADVDMTFPGRIHVRQSRGRTSGGRIRASGSLGWDGRAGIQKPFMEIAFDHIRPDKKIDRLLPESIRKAVEKLNLKNPGVNGKIVFAGPDLELDLGVYAQTARLPDLPFLLQAPSATILWRTGEETVSLDNLSARLHGKTLEGNALLYVKQPVCADFTLFGRHLPVTPEILDWLGVKTGPWSVEGKYDLELRARKWRTDAAKPSDRLRGIEASVDVRDLSMHHREHGRVGDSWYGHLALAGDRLRLAGFRGNLFNAGFEANGFIPLNGKDTSHLRLESKTIAVNQALRNALPGRYARVLKEFDLTGQCELQADLAFDKKSKIPSSARITAVIHHLEAEKSSISGSAGGSIRADLFGLNTEGFEFEGFAELSRVTVGRFESDRLSATFSGNQKRLDIPEMKVSAYGGAISFKDVAVLPGSRKWQARIMPAHIDVETLVGAFGVTGRRAPAGSLRGKIDLRGTGFEPEAMEGTGEIKIDRGRLYQFPVLASVFRVLDLQMPAQSPISDAYGTFRISGGRLDIEDLLLLGGTMPMHVAGFVDLKNNKAFNDQNMDLLVTTTKTNGILNKIPVLNWVKHYTIDWFRHLVFQARVRGTTGDYEVQSLASPLATPINRMWSLMEKLSPPAAGE